MYRVFSLILAAVMIAAALAGCAGGPASSTVNANIRVTSSDALDAAEWLTERLGVINEKVVIGTDASEYGVDLSALEDDGYIVRALGGETVIFARTEDGLVGGVRKYAKAVEAGEADAIDVTFHEGYRIEKLLFAGVPAGEYAIAVDCEDSYIKREVTNIAAKGFADLVKYACGEELSVGGESEHKVIFRRVFGDEWKEGSFRYYFEDGDLIFEFYEICGARNGMMQFLDNECGWSNLYFGIDVLAEADLVDVPSTVDVLCHPRFDAILLTIHNRSYLAEQYTVSKINSGCASYRARVAYTDHCLGWDWAREYGYWGRINPETFVCLTDENVYETVVEEVTAYIEGKLAAGQKIGDELTTINFGMEDGNAWCKCNNCVKVRIAEGNTWAGPVVRFANRVEEAIDEAGYDGLKFPIFAYCGSNQPPKTAPNPDIYVQYVYDSQCIKHDMSGDQCYPQMAWQNGYYPHMNNKTQTDWLRGWMELTPNVIGRPGPLWSGYFTFTLLDQTYEDVNCMSDAGVRWIYSDIDSAEETDPMMIVSELWNAMFFDPDMTRTEFEEELARLLEKHYGSGWRHVKRYYDLLEETEIAGKFCVTSWGTPAWYMHDLDIYSASWDEMLSELDLAEREADSAHQVDLIRRLRTAALYSGCVLLYYEAYEFEDEEMLEMLRGRWAQMFETMAVCGIKNMTERNSLLTSLDDTMWQEEYAENRRAVVFVIMGRSTIRPAPEEYSSNGN